MILSKLGQHIGMLIILLDSQLKYHIAMLITGKLLAGLVVRLGLWATMPSLQLIMVMVHLQLRQIVLRVNRMPDSSLIFLCGICEPG